MTKITEKEYNSRKQELLNKITELETLQKEYVLIFNNCSNPQKVIDEYGDKWNAAEDQLWELNRELKFLDDEWSRRNWTFSDYMEWELVSNNID